MDSKIIQSFARLTHLPHRLIIVYAMAFCYLCFVGFDFLHSGGQIGATRKGGFASGCICHGFQPSDTVRVFIEGPLKVLPGSAHTYSLVMKGGPAVAGGFNVAAAIGDLQTADSSTQRLFSPGTSSFELTHFSPKPFVNDTVRWLFSYTAPSSAMMDTLFSVGNSVNNTGNTLGDQWNLGADFYVEVMTDTSLDAPNGEVPREFSLEQNYPNPFNPSTMIRYSLKEGGEVSLKIYDIVGRLVATLVEQAEPAGSKIVGWNAANVPAGVYFYRLEVSNLQSWQGEGFTMTRKLVLIK